MESDRFDALVRSERYFTATLLPAILLHLPDGLDAFLDLIDRKARLANSQATERDAMGNARPRFARRPAWSQENVEIITEFHIGRDLAFANRLAIKSGSDEGPPERRDAPDVVIVLDDELVVCEGKFFDPVSPPIFDAQMRSQRQQVRHLFGARPSLRAYRHVAILPAELAAPPDCDAVVTWREVGLLAKQILGSNHYVTVRLECADAWYSSLLGEPGVRNYDGILPLNDLLLMCQTAAEVEIGHTGGVTDLRKRPLQYLEAKPWKWRNRLTNAGMAKPGNWIAASEFMAQISPKRQAATIIDKLGPDR